MMSKVLKDVIVYLFGDIIAKLIPFLIIPYLTNVLGPADFGELSYYIAISTFLSSLINFGQDVTYTKTKFKYDERISFFILTFGFYLSVFLFILLIIYSVSFKLSSLHILSVIVSFSMYSLNKMYSFAQVNFKVNNYVLVQIFNGLFISLITVLVFDNICGSVESRLIIIAVGNILSTYMIIFLQKKDLVFKKVKRKKLIIRYFFYNSFPIFLHGVILASKGAIDKMIIFSKYNPEFLGSYSLGFQISSIYGLLLISINKSLMPTYFQFLRKNPNSHNFIIYCSLISLIIAPLSYIITLQIPNFIYVWVFGEGFSDLSNLIALLISALSLQIPYFILGNYLIYKGKNYYLATSTAVSTIIYLNALYFLEEMSLDMIAIVFLFCNLIHVAYLFFIIRLKKIG